MKKLSELKNNQERREHLEKILKISLENTGAIMVDEEKMVHCENLVGAVSVPLGVAGPLKIAGEYTDGEYYLPLATTEGALVASVNRSCKAIRESGGANVYSYSVGVTRGPAFDVKSIAGNRKMFKWLKANEKEIAQVTQSTSKHLTYKKMVIKSSASYVFIRFYFDTDNAMGMNMATIATEAAVRLIEKETGFRCLSVAGNFDIDKKPAWINFIENRGKKVWSEVIIPKKILREVLKVDAQTLFDCWLAKCMIGSAMSGSLGFNAHFANNIAAIYIATGQDPAHVVEGSMGITTTKVLPNGDLYASVYLPAVLVGIVGGGTKLKTQQESLSMIGVKSSLALAEVIGGAVLAGEISLLASQAEGSLGKAHQKLGR